MDITIDIEKELADAQKTRQVAVDEFNKLGAERQALIAETLKPIEGKIRQMDAIRQKLGQELYRHDGEVRRLQSLKDKNNGAKRDRG